MDSTTPMSHDGAPVPDRRPIIGAFDEQVMAHTRTRTHRRPRGPAKLSLSMTSMIDVVFLLLIYFLVATDFRLGEEVYRLDLPDRTGAGSPDPFELDNEPLRISVMSTGLSASMYRLTIEGPYPQPESFEKLFEFLDQTMVGRVESGALFEADHPIIIQPSRSTRWEHAIEAFNAAARARYTNVTFAKPA